MSQEIFNLAAGVIFLMVALLHAVRLYYRWEVSIGTRKIPLWISWIGLAITGYLFYAAYALCM